MIVTGSHGGRYAAYLTLKAHPRAVIHNDAGIGRDEAGIAVISMAQAVGVAAATLSHASCRIGDAADMSGNATGGNDTLTAAGTGINVLYGDAHSMEGNAQGGNDTLISGPGNDLMWGDAAIINGVAASPTAPTGNVKTGADTFVFAPGSANDTVGDFRQSDGDRIDVSAYGFTSLTATDAPRASAAAAAGRQIP